ncbi:MAG: hypothetical protein KC464_24525, partial [Myxococcales bacterium]|nr:hypothetical protein [Myxococcales bacterium]
MRARILALAAVLVLLGPVTAFAAVGLPCAAPDDCCCAHQAAARSERAADGAAVDHAARFQRACCCEVRGDDAAPSPSSTPAIAGDHGHDAAIVAVVVPVAWIAQAPR